MKLEFSRLVFEKYLNIGQTHVTELTVAFCNFANAPKTLGNQTLAEHLA